MQPTPKGSPALHRVRTMRFVAVKSAEKQSAGMTFTTRDHLVRQKTQVISAVRGHLAEHGVIAPQSVGHLGRLAAAVEESGTLPPEVVELCGMLLDQSPCSTGGSVNWTGRSAIARTDDKTRRLMSIPGIGPITAVALKTLAPPAETFSKGREFAAWLGLTPRQNSSGGKARLGKRLPARPALTIFITATLSRIKTLLRVPEISDCVAVIWPAEVAYQGRPWRLPPSLLPRTFAALASLPRHDRSAKLVPFDDDGARLMRAYLTAKRAPVRRSWLGQLPGLVLRLATILAHLRWMAAGRHSEPTMVPAAAVSDAIRLADEYLVPHRRALAVPP